MATLEHTHIIESTSCGSGCVHNINIPQTGRESIPSIWRRPPTPILSVCLSLWTCHSPHINRIMSAIPIHRIYHLNIIPIQLYTDPNLTKHTMPIWMMMAMSVWWLLCHILFASLFKCGEETQQYQSNTIRAKPYYRVWANFDVRLIATLLVVNYRNVYCVVVWLWHNYTMHEVVIFKSALDTSKDVVFSILGLADAYNRCGESRNWTSWTLKTLNSPSLAFRGLYDYILQQKNVSIDIALYSACDALS